MESVRTLRILLVVGLAALLLTTCGTSAPEETVQESSLEPVSTILVASFNIQVFGTSKATDEDVMAALCLILPNFDVVAIQEVRGPQGAVAHILVQRLAELGYDYRVLFSEPLGSGSHLEQYLFLFNAKTVGHVDGETQVYPHDEFTRRPFLARFHTAQGFDFVLANIHTSPNLATAEIDALAKVVKYGRDRWPTQSDVIVLGDYNADCSYFTPEEMASPLQAPGFVWAIPDNARTNLGEEPCAYDRIVYMDEFTSEDATGKVGVYRFDQALGLTKAEADAVSDHYPVWAEFRTDSDTDSGASVGSDTQT